MQATVTMINYQMYRHIQAPGWSLGWSWTSGEVLWGMMGAETTERGDCSRFGGVVPPHCCDRKPKVVDLLPGTPYNQQISQCCKGGILNTMVQDLATSVSMFQMTVGAAGTTTKTVRRPKNFTLIGSARAWIYLWSSTRRQPVKICLCRWEETH